MTGTGRSVALFAALLLLFCAGAATAENAEAVSDSQQAVVDSAPELIQTDSAIAAAGTAKIDEPLYPMSPERKAKLIAYSNLRNIWRFVDLFIGLAILGLILLTGFSARLRNLAQMAKKKFLILWLFLILFLLTWILK